MNQSESGEKNENVNGDAGRFKASIEVAATGEDCWQWQCGSQRGGLDMTAQDQRH